MKNCDHFMEFIITDIQGNSRCAGCKQILSSSQKFMMSQKALAHCKDMKREKRIGKII